MIKPKSIKIKAWNIQDKLIKRVRSVDCVKSELYKEGHVLLQYTGMEDQNGVEVYDGDVLLSDHKKHVVSWDEENDVWIWTDKTNQATKKFTLKESKVSLRLCHSFESMEFKD